MLHQPLRVLPLLLLLLLAAATQAWPPAKVTQQQHTTVLDCHYRQQPEPRADWLSVTASCCGAKCGGRVGATAGSEFADVRHFDLQISAAAAAVVAAKSDVVDTMELTGWVRAKTDDTAHPPPPLGCVNGSACAANFSSHFQSSMVLQSGPARAAVYGMAPVVGAEVTVTLNGTSFVTTVGASLTWKVLFPPKPPGGTYTVSTACTKGCINATATVVYDVTFGVSNLRQTLQLWTDPGHTFDKPRLLPPAPRHDSDVALNLLQDVWLCSGQSNAELSVEYTFDRNESVAGLLAGRYDNVRMMLGTHASATSPLWLHKGYGGKWARATDLVNASGPVEHSEFFGCEQLAVAVPSSVLCLLVCCAL